MNLERLVYVFLEDLRFLVASGMVEAADLMQMDQEVWFELARRVNLLAALRAIPIGVPSMMAGRLPIETPWGDPSYLEISSLVSVVVLWAVLFLLGLWIGALYFGLVAMVSVDGKFDWQQITQAWPRWGMQSVLLTAILLIFLLAVTLPASFTIGLMGLLSIQIGQLAFLLFGGVLVWLLFPLLLSPHGIFLYGRNALASIRDSLGVTRFTSLRTMLFFLVVFVLWQGLNRVWNIPDETSMWTIVGIAGHAFISTSLLAASFVYYKQSYDWMQSALSRLTKPNSIKE
ncbi:MAG: hypothetical protein AB1345_01760 [Chloroflexota bacterium]